MSDRQGRRRPPPIPPPSTHSGEEQGEPEMFKMDDLDVEFLDQITWEPIPQELQYLRSGDNCLLPFNPIKNMTVDELESISREIQAEQHDDNSGQPKHSVDDFFDDINERPYPPNVGPPPPGEEKWIYDSSRRRPPSPPVLVEPLEPEPLNDLEPRIEHEPLSEEFLDYAANQWRSPTRPGAFLFHMLDQRRIPPNLPPPEVDIENNNSMGALRIRLTSAQTYFDELEVFILVNLSPEEGDALRSLAERWPIWPIPPPPPEVLYIRFKQGRAEKEEFRGHSRLPRSPASPQGAGRDFSELYQLSPSPPQLGAEALDYREIDEQSLVLPPHSRRRGPAPARRPIIRRIGAALRCLLMGRIHTSETETETEIQVHDSTEELGVMPLLIDETGDIFEAPIEDIDKYSKIPLSTPRNGRFSSVHIMLNRETGQKCALKIFHSRTPDSQIAREISILQKVHDGPNLINLLALLVDADTNKRTLVLEYIENEHFGQLYTKFNTYDNKFYFYELLRGLEFLNRKGIMHRSIRARNILIDHERCKLRLIDFSVATVCYTDPIYGKHSTKVIPPAMKPPEVLLGLTSYDFAVDMWAVGLLMALAIFRAPCFPSCRHDSNQLVQITSLLGTEELFAYVKEYNIELSPELADLLLVYRHPRVELSTYINPENQYLVSGKALDLLRLILCYDHKRRLSATQALQHAYFDEIRL